MSSSCELAVAIFDLTAAVPVVSVELISKDGEEPGIQIRSRLETVEGSPGFNNRFLHEVVGIVTMTGERHRKGAKPRDSF